VRRDLLLEGALLGCLLLLITTWFAAQPAGLPAVVPFAVLLVTAAVRWGRMIPPMLRPPGAETVAALSRSGGVSILIVKIFSRGVMISETRRLPKSNTRWISSRS